MCLVDAVNIRVRSLRTDPVTPAAASGAPPAAAAAQTTAPAATDGAAAPDAAAAGGTTAAPADPNASPATPPPQGPTERDLINHGGGPGKLPSMVANDANPTLALKTENSAPRQTATRKTAAVNQPWAVAENSNHPLNMVGNGFIRSTDWQQKEAEPGYTQAQFAKTDPSLNDMLQSNEPQTERFVFNRATGYESC